MRLLNQWPLLVVLGLLAGCRGDPVLAGRQAIESEPEEAVAILTEAAAEMAPCFDCQMYLGLAFEKTGKPGDAMAAYEAALSIGSGARQAEAVKGRLLSLYRASFDGEVNPSQRLMIARKAAPLEAELGTEEAWANEFLLARLEGGIDAMVRDGRYEGIREQARAIQALYLPVVKKKAAARRATDLLRKGFVEKARAAFGSKLAPGYAAKGLYDGSAGEIVLKNRFKIPSVREDPSLDPKAQGFMARVRGLACLDLRKTLDEAVFPIAGMMDFKKPDEGAMDRLFGKMFTYAKAGFESYGAEKKRPAGQVYLCMIRVPLDAFLGELFRFSE